MSKKGKKKDDISLPDAFELAVMILCLSGIGLLAMALAKMGGR